MENQRSLRSLVDKRGRVCARPVSLVKNIVEILQKIGKYLNLSKISK